MSIKESKSKVREENEIGIKGLRIKIKQNISKNIFLRAFPYAILISALTSIGLFGGFTIGKGLGGSIAGFVFALSFSMLGFFAGLLISYTIITKEKIYQSAY